MTVRKLTQSELAVRLPMEKANIRRVIDNWAADQMLQPSSALLPDADLLPGTNPAPDDFDDLTDRMIAEFRRFIWNGA